MFEKWEQYLFGLNSDQIKRTIVNNPEEVVPVEFGKLLGSVYFVKPGKKIDIAKLLNELDNYPDGRKPMSAVDYVLGGPSLLASTDKNRKNFHGIFMRSLSHPNDYMQFMQEALNAYLRTDDKINFKLFAVKPIRQAIIRGLFSLSEPDNDFNQALEALSKANTDEEKDFATEIRLMLTSVHYPVLLNTAVSVLAHDAKQQYANNIQKFIQGQADIILNDLHQYAERKPITNVISLSIIELIKEENEPWRNQRNELNFHLNKMQLVDLTPYLKNAFIKTLPGMMVASDSIMAIVTGALTALAKNQKLLKNLLVEIQDENLVSDDVSEMRKKIDTNKLNGGLLHRIYLEALRLRSLEESINDKPFSKGVVWRYTDRDIHCNGYDIPAGSTIAVLTSFYFYDSEYWPKPDHFKPSRYKNEETGALNQALTLSIHGVFSQGYGACPASHISEYLFKAFILHVVTKYNFNIEHDSNEQNRTNYNICLTSLDNNVSESSLLQSIL